MATRGDAKAYVMSGAWRKPFLETLARTGSIIRSRVAASISARTYQRERQRNPQFQRDVDDAILAAADVLEQEARRRAVDGVDEPIVHQGQISGDWIDPETNMPCHPDTPGAQFRPLTVKRYSDTLLIFLLKGAMPHRYREKAIDFNQTNNLSHNGNAYAGDHNENNVRVDTRAMMNILLAKPDALKAAQVLASQMGLEDDTEDANNLPPPPNH